MKQTIAAQPLDRTASNGHFPASTTLANNGHESRLEGLPEKSAHGGATMKKEYPRERFAADYHNPSVPSIILPYALAKRSFDIVFALLLLTILAVPMMLLALLVKLTSRGDIIFKQVRVGKGGRYFWCYKFRSMCADAESKKAELMHLNTSGGPTFKVENDPRITPIGKFMRKFSLDELPQLINVLKGEMSIVGPRPATPDEVMQYKPEYLRRQSVPQGLTCLWQVSGRSNVTFERWMQLDLEYIEKMSFWFDLWIVLRTIPAVLLGTGAR